MMPLAILLSISVAAIAQYGPSNSSAAPTPALVQECVSDGISLDKCTEQAVLSLRRTYGSPNTSEPSLLGLDKIDAAILAGCGIAFVAGVLYVVKARNIKKAT